MTTAPAATVAIVVLSAAGLLPVLALVGPRWIAVPLAPLTGAVLAAGAATAYLGIGGSFLGWFVAVAVVSGCAVGTWWASHRDRLPRWSGPRTRPLFPGRYRATGAVGAVAVTASCIWCLRGLSSPTIGFDARAVWLSRAGWFLQSHHQLLVDMRVPYVALIQSAYPPLVSASTAVAWGVTGNHSLRLGVVVIAVLNACALATAAFALVECGRHVALRQAVPDDRGIEDIATEDIGTVSEDTDRHGAVSVGTDRRLPLAPLVVGVVASILLVFVAFGITEPFITNGYADPIWSLAAVGAVAYGLQLRSDRSARGAALVLLLVAGLSKDEGFITAVALIALVALRAVMAMPSYDRRRWWWRPVMVGAIELAAIGAWPVLMRILHARGDSSFFSLSGTAFTRARATFDGMAPYLHVVLLAAPLAMVGGLLLATVRRRSEVGNDWWAWAGLACGLVSVSGALIAGSGAIEPWLLTTVHRVTEFPALAGWWIVATWAVVASGAPAITRPGRRGSAPPSAGPGSEAPLAAERRPASLPR
jgi:hypothetical protein